MLVLVFYIWIWIWGVGEDGHSHLNISVTNLGIFHPENEIIELVLGSPNREARTFSSCPDCNPAPPSLCGQAASLLCLMGSSSCLPFSPPLFCGQTFLGAQKGAPAILVWRVCQLDCREDKEQRPRWRWLPIAVRGASTFLWRMAMCLGLSRGAWCWEQGLGPDGWVCILALVLTSCVTFGKVLDLFLL